MTEKLAIALLLLIGCCFCGGPKPETKREVVLNPFYLCQMKCPTDAIVAVCGPENCKCVCTPPEGGKEPM